MKTLKFLLITSILIAIFQSVVIPVFFLVLREVKLEMPTPN